MAKYSDNYVIGIGASAGGMEALEAFFENNSVEGASYVVVQHLSKDHKSNLVQILSSHSRLTVCEAGQGMLVEPNVVYVIPNREFMTLKEGRLWLEEKQKEDSPYKTINIFFESLAKAAREKAVAIILSGTGNDGADGIEAVKAAGGLVIVQDPESALYKEMPENAIASAMADAVLLPESMPKLVKDYLNHLALGEPFLFPLVQKKKLAIEPILDYLRNNFPVDFSNYKPSTLIRRVERRMSMHRLSTVEQYLSFLESNPEEVELLAKDFLISVTDFFRDGEVFETIEREVIPAIIKKGGTEFKAWVAGCATGEEAYSMAILISETLKKTSSEMTVRIFATDIDKVALGIASKGIYSRHDVRNLSELRLKRFFTKSGSKYEVNHEIREMLIFAHHDLIKNPPYCQMDLISCRNVLIYMNSMLQRKIQAMLHFGLKSNGFLILGPSENLDSLKPYFSEVSKKWNVFRKAETRKGPHLESFTPQIVEMITVPTMKNPLVKTPAAKNLPFGEVVESLLKEFGYVGVYTDKDLNVLNKFGDLGRFMLQKILTLSLKELLPDALAVAVGTVSKKALKLNEKVALQSVPLAIGESLVLVDIVVIPTQSRKDDEGALVILFKEQQAKGRRQKSVPQFDFQFHSKELLSQTEAELQEMKESLASAFEKINASNENMHSFNEELLSANEEMQSTNEEMQSVNEELQTINAERLQKIKELTDLNDELDNFFKSNVNGQMFVDNDLILKRFSPSTTAFINLQKGDVGRPIGHITTNFRNEVIADDIQTVIRTGEMLTKEVQSKKGQWFQMAIMPFTKSEGNRRDGVTVTFNDITGIKAVQEELALSNQSLFRINEDLKNFVYTASHDLNGPLSNVESLVDLIVRVIDGSVPEADQPLGFLKKSIVNFKAVIKELTDIGRVEGEAANQQDWIKLEELLEEVRLSILDKIVGEDVVVKTDIAATEILFSRKNMRSILYNLMSNAIKFRSPKRTPIIEIKTLLVPNFTVLSFSDNGIGMEPAQLEHIFKMYHRLDSSAEGQGLGLFLIKKIIDSKGGKIEVTSEVGKGTTFKLYFKRE
jgi:two-component system, chemotaxis family, CheB/CheR fusion protein